MNRILCAGAGVAALIAIGPARAQDRPADRQQADAGIHDAGPGGPRDRTLGEIPGGMPGRMGARPPLTRAAAEAMAADRFARLDTDHDQIVTRAEIAAAHATMRARGAARMQAHRAAMFDRIDTNKDGQISRQEFVDAAPPPPPPGGRDGAFPPPPPGGPGRDAPPPPPAPSDRPGMRHGMHHDQSGGAGGMMEARWFDRADTDHDGRLTLAEAKASALAIFDRVDLNHDGIIEPGEQRAAFRMMMAHGRRGEAGRGGPGGRGGRNGSDESGGSDGSGGPPPGPPPEDGPPPGGPAPQG